MKKISLLWGLGIMNIISGVPAPIPLFKQFPHLEMKLSFVSLGQFPTPIHQLVNLGNHLQMPNIFIKREDLSGKLFGGNKVRKLEFLLADALKNNYKSVICYGGIASNNVVTTAAYANQRGIECIALLMDQPHVANLKRNLALDQYYGCKLFLCPHDRELTAQELQRFLGANNIDTNPYVIPMGGSNKFGVIGWVNAIFERKSKLIKAYCPSQITYTLRAAVWVLLQDYY